MGIVVLFGGVVWWFVWRKLLTGIGRYDLVPTHQRLTDGTVVVVYERVRKNQ